MGAFAISGQARADKLIDDSNGCKVSARDNTDLSVWTATWAGPCVNGVADGQGALEWYKNGALDQRYEGNLAQGQLTGSATLTWTNGDRYVGPYVDGRRDGIGTFDWGNGDHYEGQFTAGLRTGKGLYVWPSGKRYEGDFVEDRITGQGVQVEPDGNVYRGAWLNGQFHGPGLINFADGRQLSGQYANGKIVDGAMTKADGSLIATYSNGVRQDAPSSGSGTLSFLASLLGAAAQGAASSGGRNAAQYQAVATALQASNSANAVTGYSAPAPAAAGSGDMLAGISQMDTLNQGDYAGVNLGKNVKFDKPVNECIGLVNMPKRSTYDSPGPGLTNKCGFPIMVYWCADAVEAGGMANNMCAKHFNGKYSLEPGQKSKLEQIVSMKAFRAIACRKPFTSGGAQTIKWSGDDFRAPCINSSIYNWDDFR